jgi:hypothetical protein
MAYRDNDDHHLPNADDRHGKQGSRRFAKHPDKLRTGGSVRVAAAIQFSTAIMRSSFRTSPLIPFSWLVQCSVSQTGGFMITLETCLQSAGKDMAVGEPM